MPAATSSPTSTRSAESGTGLVGAVVGVTVFLTLLLFAVQLALNLYATSTVTAVAFDAVREVAATPGTAADRARAEDRARHVLDQYEERGGRLAFEWDVRRDDVVVLHVVTERPALLAGIRFPFQRVERTVTARWERFR
jgi:hypothetical protein